MDGDIIVSRVGLPTEGVTRVEVIGDAGRLFTLTHVLDVTIELQDDGHTMKVFLRDDSAERCGGWGQKGAADGWIKFPAETCPGCPDCRPAVS